MPVWDILTLAAVLGVALLFWRFLPGYVSKKAENLATKEDVAAITRQVESAREPYAQALEQFRADLELHRSALTNRQQLYVGFAEALSRVFISGRLATEQDVREFHARHAAVFLAAPDHVIAALNEHLDFQVLAKQVGQEQVQEELKQTFAELVLTLRREAFFSEDETKLSREDFRFVSVQAAGANQDATSSDGDA